jgi:hypothetical protein
LFSKQDTTQISQEFLVIIIRKNCIKADIIWCSFRWMENTINIYQNQKRKRKICVVPIRNSFHPFLLNPCLPIGSLILQHAVTAKSTASYMWILTWRWTITVETYGGNVTCNIYLKSSCKQFLE